MNSLLKQFVSIDSIETLKDLNKGLTEIIRLREFVRDSNLLVDFSIVVDLVVLEEKLPAIQPVPPKRSYELWFNGFKDGRKIPIIKTIREITGQGLKEAKGIVENPPSLVMRSAFKSTIDSYFDRMKEDGAFVVIKEIKE